MRFIRKAWAVIFAGIIWILSACGINFGKSGEPETPTQPESTTVAITAENTTIPVTEPELSTNRETTTEKETEKVMIMKIDGKEINVIWEDNDSVDEIKEELKNGPITVSMTMYGGNEQYGSLGRSFTSDDEDTVTESGDIVLYNDSNIVVFYGSNSWAYTRLGKISGMTDVEITSMLSSGNVMLTLELK